MNPNNLVAGNCQVWLPRCPFAHIRSSSLNPEFIFRIVVRFETLNPEHGVIRGDVFWLERASMMEYVTPWVNLSRRLSSHLQIPFHFHTMLIRKLVTFARQIARDPDNQSRRTIPISALLTLVEAQELPQLEASEEEEEEESSSSSSSSQETQESREEREWVGYLRSEAANITYFGQGGRASMSAVKALEKCELVELVVEEEEERSCAICMSKIEVGTQVKRLPCKHEYHEDCILSWLTRSNLCPLCRFQMPLD